MPFNSCQQFISDGQVLDHRESIRHLLLISLLLICHQFHPSIPCFLCTEVLMDCLLIYSQKWNSQKRRILRITGLRVLRPSTKCSVLLLHLKKTSFIFQKCSYQAKQEKMMCFELFVIFRGVDHQYGKSQPKW